MREMLIVRSRKVVPIRPTEERSQHIIRRHPEMDGQRRRALETLTGPDSIQQDDFGTLLAIRLYPDTPLSSKLPVVVCRELGSEDGLSDQSVFGQEANDMEAVTILERPVEITSDYDEDADVLYLSIGEPQPAVGLDIDEGVVLRYDEVRKEVVGLTLIGLRARLVEGLATVQRQAG